MTDFSKLTKITKKELDTFKLKEITQNEYNKINKYIMEYIKTCTEFEGKKRKQKLRKLIEKFKEKKIKLFCSTYVKKRKLTIQIN